MIMNKKCKWLPLKIIPIVLLLMATVFLLWNAFATPYPWAIDSLQQKAVEQATQEAINTARQEGDDGKPYLKDIDYTELTLGGCYVGTNFNTQKQIVWEIRYRDALVGYVAQDLGILRACALAGNEKSTALCEVQAIDVQNNYKKVKDSSVHLGPFNGELPLGWVTVDGHRTYRLSSGELPYGKIMPIASQVCVFDDNGYLVREGPLEDPPSVPDT